MKAGVRIVLFLLLLSAGRSVDAAEVEMEACRYTPEVKKELNLSAAQEPQVAKVYADLASSLKQIQEAMKDREQKSNAGASPEAMEEATKQVIALENQCREKGHHLLKPILTEAQNKRILEMEDVHRRKALERRTAGQPSHP